MSNIIIFGNRDFAELADYYITTDTDHKVAAFCVSSQYLKDDSFKGKPVIAFEEIQSNFSPKDYKFFAPMSPSGMNTKRADIFNGIK
ncbi:MAG: hypothetical protein KC414_15175, partial [Romboutsia sp.]|nr:hypothetical protein [Romboutsia sp.]